MTDNRTSMAVENYRLVTDGSNAIVISYKDWQAIVEKYKRMEEALQQIATRKERPEDYCQSLDEGNFCPADDMAKEALLFDPLSPPSAK